MNLFERNLHDALRRREAPPGFEGRVLARVREMEQRREARFSWKWSRRWVSVAAMFVVLLGGASLYQERQRRLEAEKTKDQLMLALRLTGSKLRLVQERLSGMEQKTIELPGQR